MSRIKKEADEEEEKKEEDDGALGDRGCRGERPGEWGAESGTPLKMPNASRLGSVQDTHAKRHDIGAAPLPSQSSM
jgi:hypothetical protein